jgi:hypothetical protein
MKMKTMEEVRFFISSVPTVGIVYYFDILPLPLSQWWNTRFSAIEFSSWDPYRKI